MTAPSARRTFHDLVMRADPSAPCLILPSGETLDYGTMTDRAAQLAGALLRHGLRRGEAVLAWLPNLPEWVIAFLACARIGSPIIGVNTRFRAHELEAILKVAPARILLTTAQLGRVRAAEILTGIAPDLIERIDRIVLVGDDREGAWPRPAESWDEFVHDSDPAPVLGVPDSPLVAFTTSGTTNAPKLVLHRQHGVSAHAAAIGPAMGLTAPETFLLQLAPFCGAFGFSQLIGALGAGAPSIIPPTFDAKEAVRLASQHRVTNIFGTDDMLDRMLAASDLLAPFPDLRFFGHANFNPELHQLGTRAAERGIFLRGLFGMSETLALFAIQPEDAPLERRQASGGIPVAGTARVRGLESQELLAADETGELELHGPGLMAEYLGNPDATEAAFTDDGYFRTGDLAKMTGDGGFYHVGRIGDAMRLGGFLVDPAEIEQALLEDPGLRVAQVVDIVTPEGHRPVAFVIPADGCVIDEAALIGHCRKVLAPFKAPIRIFVVDSFPTFESANGIKVQRHVLRARAQEIIDRDIAF